MALSGRAQRGVQCLLSEVKQTSKFTHGTSAYDPKQTLLLVGLEGQSEIAQAARDDDGDPANPHRRIPAANHN